MTLQRHLLTSGKRHRLGVRRRRMICVSESLLASGQFFQGAALLRLSEETMLIQNYALRGLALLSLLTSCAMDAVPLFRWHKDVKVVSATDSGLVAIPFDSEIYSNTQDGFPDVRLSDSSPAFVPFLIRKQSELQEQVRRSSWVADQPELRPTEDGLEIRIALAKDDPQPTSISFTTPLKNFEQRVQIFGTEPGQPEQALVKESMIFDYSKFMDVRRLELPLPPSRSRRFRVLIGSLTSNQETEVMQLTRRLRGGSNTEVEREERTSIERRAFRIDRIEFWGETKKFGVKSELVVSYPVSEIKVEQDKEKQATVVLLTSRREPLTELVLETTSNNFRRTARVEVLHKSGIKADWKEIGSATVSRFQIADINESQLKISFPEQRHESYRIVIDNADSPPLEIVNVRAMGHSYEALCLREQPTGLSVVYGSVLTDRPSYDTAALQLALDRGLAASVAELGPQTQATAADDMPMNLKSLVNNPYVIGAVVCVLVALLALSLMNAGKRIAALPPETEE
jgi:hypothetical protein